MAAPVIGAEMSRALDAKVSQGGSGAEGAGDRKSDRAAILSEGSYPRGSKTAHPHPFVRRQTGSGAASVQAFHRAKHDPAANGDWQRRGDRC